MEVIEYASEHDEVKDLLDMKKSLKWADEDRSSSRDSSSSRRSGSRNSSRQQMAR